MILASLSHLIMVIALPPMVSGAHTTSSSLSAFAAPIKYFLLEKIYSKNFTLSQSSCSCLGFAQLRTGLGSSRRRKTLLFSATMSVTTALKIVHQFTAPDVATVPCRKVVLIQDRVLV